jgi:hypothetical protein
MNMVPQGLAAALADRYRIERELGAGGMATVYLAEDLRHHRKVAVKVLRPELSADAQEAMRNAHTRWRVAPMTFTTVDGRLLAMALVLLAGCGGKSTNSLAGDEAAGRPAGATAAAPKNYTLATGTRIDASLTTTISSRHAKAGDGFTASVVEDVKSAGGSVAIPAGSTVQGTILEVKPAPNSRSTGTLVLAVASVTVLGTSYDLNASIDSLDTISKNRGVEGVDVARTAGGAAAGAILGQVIGKNTKGTLIGAVIGAGAGAVVSEVMKDSDIVLPAGSHLLLTLQQRLTVSAK